MPTKEAEPISAEAMAAVENLLGVNASPPDATIHQRMVAILAELPAIGKDDYNQQQSFHFRSHDTVLNALNPLLAKHGVFVVPEALERVASERTTSRGSTMYEVNVLVRFTFYGAAGDSVVAAAWGEGTDMGDKSTNKAMTMAFKNVLAQAFAVSTAETVDTDSQTPEETTRGQRQAGGSQGGRSPEKAAQTVFPEGFKHPAGWTELKERLVTAGVTEDDQPFWLSDAVAQAPEGQGFGRAKLVLALAEAEDLSLHQDPREFMQAAVAKAFNGFAVPGPPWRLAPKEEHLPTHEEYEEAAVVALEESGEPVGDGATHAYDEDPSISM